MVAKGEGNAAENAFHSASKFMEGISEMQEEIEQKAKQGTYKFNKGEEAAMEAVSQVPKSELEAMGRWLIS